ncbi:hypothetical protein L21SP3_00864 [Sedimentisphaera cyanobacteriorum]|uniref:Uncharacterized protein n=1 Tax=Sedimentisphaera cyanobacteriorum TaxID=1940790 RepID=A0A1Q2HP77_9BACT|nr:hypothetical protein L21SP3_00864 [Sedimentisphaera cyanobacteriorum]
MIFPGLINNCWQIGQWPQSCSDESARKRCHINNVPLKLAKNNTKAAIHNNFLVLFILI